MLHSLYARIAVVYLVLLVILCTLCVWLTVINGNRFVAEMDQRFNLMLASDIAAQLAPSLQQRIDGVAVRDAVARITSVNPKLEISVIAQDGHVLAAFSCLRDAAQSVRVGPIERFMDAQATLPIRGEDPCAVNTSKVFSAANVDLGVRGDGYLYVLLNGPLDASEASRVRGSYLLRSLGVIVIFALLFTALVGLLLFAWLTRRFRRLTAAVEQFEKGDYAVPVADRSRDEIGDLARAFNAMAGTIQAQVDALRYTDQARRDLVANISHDFRTPLTALHGYTERLLEQNRPLDGMQRRIYLNAIVENIAHLTRLAESLSTLSQLDGHAKSLQPEAFSIAELVQDIVVKFAPEAERRGVTLKAGDRSGLPAVRADIASIERALANLVDNALCNTGEGGQVQIELSETVNAIGVTVSDTGVGIHADEITLVTQRFYLTQASRKQGRAGSGLGLAIAREIVELHGSNLRIRSVVGEGSEFSFELAMDEPN